MSADKIKGSDPVVEYVDPDVSEVVSDSALQNIHDDPHWLPFRESIGKAPERPAAILLSLSKGPLSTKSGPFISPASIWRYLVQIDKCHVEVSANLVGLEKLGECWGFRLPLVG